MADESYEKIVRRTVPEPDLGVRPAKDEQDLSRHRAGAAADHVAHPQTAAEKRALAAALKALSSEPSLDMNHVRVGIDGRELVLKGNVPGLATRARVEAIAEQVEGIDRVDNQLAVRP
jgi:hypothetical protein